MAPFDFKSAPVSPHTSALDLASYSLSPRPGSLPAGFNPASMGALAAQQQMSAPAQQALGLMGGEDFLSASAGARMWRLCPVLFSICPIQSVCASDSTCPMSAEGGDISPASDRILLPGFGAFAWGGTRQMVGRDMSLAVVRCSRHCGAEPGERGGAAGAGHGRGRAAPGPRLLRRLPLRRWGFLLQTMAHANGLFLKIAGCSPSTTVHLSLQAPPSPADSSRFLPILLHEMESAADGHAPFGAYLYSEDVFAQRGNDTHARPANPAGQPMAGGPRSSSLGALGTSGATGIRPEHFSFAEALAKGASRHPFEGHHALHASLIACPLRMLGTSLRLSPDGSMLRTFCQPSVV